MAIADLRSFLLDYSSDAALRVKYDQDPDAVLAAAGLSAAEQALVRAGDDHGIRSYLGDGGSALTIKFVAR